MAAEQLPTDWEFDEIFDSLDLGCGDFLYDLRLQIRAMPPGGRLLVASRDVGAPREIPAWCRLTGHRLEEERHPFYLIVKRKGRDT